MLSRRLLSKARVLKTINRASSSAASSPTPPAIIKTPAPTVGTQAPNYPTTWSANQRPRPTSADGPRFEQTTMEVQPNPLSAMALIAEEPVRMVHGRKAVCDGGGGPLGHPKIYINLDQPGPRACGYWQVLVSIASLLDKPDMFSHSGLRFEQEHHH